MKPVLEFRGELIEEGHEDGQKIRMVAIGWRDLVGSLFYYIGHVLLGWSLKGVALTYLNLMGWLTVAQFATYCCERISSYSGRIKRRMLIVGATALGIWIEIFA